MDSNTEDRIGTPIKVNQFLKDNSLALAVNPEIAVEQAKMESDTERFFQNDSTATRPLEGATVIKNDALKSLADIMKLCRAGGLAYFTVNPDPKKFSILNRTDSDIDKLRDKEIYTVADQFHDVLEPVKALMAPFLVTSANVDSITSRMLSYKDVMEEPRSEEGISVAAGKERDRLLVKLFDVSLEKIDTYMLPYKYVNPLMYDQYKVARAVDSSGGSSDSDGYVLQNFVLAPGATASFGAIPAADKDIYLRQIGGTAGVIVCTAAALADACASGFIVAPNTTVKKPFGDLGLSGGTVVNFTNPGATTVTFRAGLKA